MTQMDVRLDPESGLSRTDGVLTVRGLNDPVTILRDAYGVAHVRAANEHDAWFGQGFAAAQDRLWQMEYDRRRAAGRWSEAAGPVGLPADRLARRLQLTRAAQSDVDVMSEGTRAMFEAYAAGVNAFLTSGEPLPVEYALTGITPEPWEPWHSAAGFKVRHVLMGVWQQKLCQGRLLAMIGADAFERLYGGRSAHGAVILPPGGRQGGLYDLAAEEIAAASEQLGFLAEVEAGSNSWAVHGSRTSTGMPVLCNDSHRALDVQSVYWQVHVTCPQFDAIGATFPGVPGFPHFGHNGKVGWNITHTSADYQDLYVEQFDTANPGSYRTPDGWAGAEHRVETIAVRGASSEEIELWRTQHGPVVHGDPREGLAIALRYTATDQPSRAFEAIRPMLAAGTVAELHEAQREWVDPVNNLVSADTAGNIGYVTRGYLPVRSSQAHRLVPVPGWTGEHEWTGRVPFEQLPQAINPPAGYIATANQRVIPGEEPYISHTFSPPSRAERIVELITAQETMTPAQVIAMQGDTTSVPGRAWGALLARSGPFEGDAERARALLAGWDGNLLPASAQAQLYAYVRRGITRALFQPVVGERAWTWLNGGEPAALGRMLTQWLAAVIAGLADEYRDAAPDGRTWEVLLPEPLAWAWRTTTERYGPDPAAWRWDADHRTNAQHTLAAAFPELAPQLNPPSVRVGGDSDTLQCAGYGWSGRADFHITNLSVYRQAIDLSDIEHATFIIPGGVAAQPGTPHFADQLELWRTHQRIAMHYAAADVDAAAVGRLELRG